MFTSYKDKMVSYYILSSTVRHLVVVLSPRGRGTLVLLVPRGSACANRKITQA